MVKAGRLETIASLQSNVVKDRFVLLTILVSVSLATIYQIEPVALLGMGCVLGIGSTVLVEKLIRLLQAERQKIDENSQLVNDQNSPDLLGKGLDERSIKAVRDQRFREVAFDESADAIFLVDAETLLTLDCNHKAVELYEAEDKQQLMHIEGHRLQRHPFTSAELAQISSEMATLGGWSRELEYVTLKGNLFWGSLAAKQIQISGRPINLVRITDVTQRKRTEEQLRISLYEKELLLKEIHHRVKNNLHVIANLLDLQTEYVTDENLLDLFADSQTRIQAMALIHEQLYQAKDFGHIDFSEYIHRLMSNLSFSWGDQMRSVQTIIEADPIQINLDTAIPCGLLINELVTNAFKHAFPGGRAGCVKIQLSRCPDQKLSLKIQDDGIGFPSGIDWQSSASLGLKLVQILARQLKASIHFDCHYGTEMTFTFSELQYRPRI